jgi:hypothetical protein
MIVTVIAAGRERRRSSSQATQTAAVPMESNHEASARPERAVIGQGQTASIRTGMTNRRMPRTSIVAPTATSEVRSPVPSGIAGGGGACARRCSRTKRTASTGVTTTYTPTQSHAATRADAMSEVRCIGSRWRNVVAVIATTKTSTARAAIRVVSQGRLPKDRTVSTTPPV